MRLLDYGGSEVFAMTPLLGLSWTHSTIWEPWTKGKLKDAFVLTVDMDDNPHLDEATKLRLLSGLSREEREARKAGRFVHFAGLIYPEFDPELHVIPQSPVPEEVPVYVGIDPGIRHPAAVVWAYIDYDGTMVVFDEIRESGQTAPQVAQQIAEHNLGQQVTPAFYVIDPSARNKNHATGRSVQDEFTQAGIPTIAGQNSVMAGLSNVKARLQAGKLQVMANCPGTIEEFQRYRWASPSRVEDAPKEKPVKAGEDLMDALRYLCMARPWVPEHYEEDTRTELQRLVEEDQNRIEQAGHPMGAVLV